jgi:hypothetical protein
MRYYPSTPVARTRRYYVVRSVVRFIFLVSAVGVLCLISGLVWK